MKSYYEILGVSENADAVTIKQAYKSLVKKYHPDVYKGEDRDTKFQEIQQAYDVVGDPDKRIIYDQQGRESYEQSQKYGSTGTGFNASDMFGGFERTYKTVDINSLPMWKKILFILGIIALAIILIIGAVFVTIINLIFKLIKGIFE